MYPNLKILIIEDDEDDFFITSQYLKNIDSIKVSCDWCYNISEAQQKLNSNKYDFYFLDYRLGAKTGLELLQEAIENGTDKPIVMLTGKGTPEIDKAAVKIGAYDYLVKNELSSEKLERCLRYSIERYRSFKLINESEKKYRFIFENALSFIFTCDKNFLFNNCNQACEYLLGYAPQELKDALLFNFLIEEDKDKIQELTLEKKNIRNLNLKFVTKEGLIKNGNLSLTYFEREGMEAHWQGVIFDETLRMQAEQAKLHLEKLDATYRVVNTLAHDVRTPLTNINLSLDALINADTNETQYPYIEIIKRGSRRINDIISELLQLSRVLELNPELTDLNALIDEVLYIAQDRIQLKGIKTEVFKLNFPVVKEIDKEKFKIAILNLVVNAIDAMNKPDGLLTVALIKNSRQTEIQIKDNGCGMNDKELRKLFEPYYTTKKSGIGLGLISALNIVKSHKANIEVDSTFGEGTTFKVVFYEDTET